MNTGRKLVSALLLASLATGVPTTAHAFPKMPKIPKTPKLPKPPKVRIPNLPSPPTSSPETPDAKMPESKPTGGALAGGSEDDFMQDYLKLASSIDANDDGAKIDSLVDEMKAAVQRLAAGRYTGISDMRRQQVYDQRKQLADVHLSRVDRELDWAVERVSRNGGSNPEMPVLAYNQILTLDTELYIATTLFPKNEKYVQAKNKVGSLLAKFASREQAAQAFDDMALAAAAKVRMPAATERNKSVENMFRQAWGTSGIPYSIRKIHIRGGWGVKREYGRVIGRTRTAAIAAKDPKSNRCNLYDFTLLTQNGGGVRRLAHSTKRIACENIPK